MIFVMSFFGISAWRAAEVWCKLTGWNCIAEKASAFSIHFMSVNGREVFTKPS